MQSVAIITIGDELLIGQVVDTNSAWIGSRMAENGLAVKDIHSVSDTSEAITEALDRTLGRFDVVITTGGLGPTKDDITKHTLARYFGLDMERDEAVFAHVRALMAARGVEFNALNQSQGDMPRGFTALHNAVGTAPGMFYESRGTLLFSLPGVPFEMKSLLEDHVLPIIDQRLSRQSVLHRTMLVYGLPESELAARIEAWEDALPDFLHLAYLPNPGGIRLRLSAYGVDSSLTDPIIDECFAELCTLIPECVVGEWPTSIEAEVGRLLAERGAYMATAESCTGGAIAARITAVAGASRYFKAGVVAYSNDTKVGVLEVDGSLIATYGAVSTEVARAMAVGAREVLGVDYAIATSGIAGPDGGSGEKPVGTVCVAVAGPDSVETFRKNFGQPRGVCVERASSFALNALRLMLRNGTIAP